jgi:hypothetical protein
VPSIATCLRRDGHEYPPSTATLRNTASSSGDADDGNGKAISPQLHPLASALGAAMQLRQGLHASVNFASDREL